MLIVPSGKARVWAGFWPELATIGTVARRAYVTQDMYGLCRAEGLEFGWHG